MDIDIDALYDTKSSDFVFKCEHCPEKFSIQYLRFAILLYGAIFLTEHKYGYLGITCPTCVKTTLRKMNRKKFDSWRKHLDGEMWAVVYEDHLRRTNGGSAPLKRRFGVFKEHEMSAVSPYILSKESYGSPKYCMNKNLENYKDPDWPKTRPTDDSLKEITHFLPRTEDKESKSKVLDIPLIVEVENANNSRFFPRYCYVRELQTCFEKVRKDHFPYGSSSFLTMTMDILTLGFLHWLNLPKKVFDTLFGPDIPFKGIGLKKTFELLSLNKPKSKHQEDQIGRIWYNYHNEELQTVLSKIGFRIEADNYNIEGDFSYSEFSVYKIVKEHIYQLQRLLRGARKGSRGNVPSRVKEAEETFNNFIIISRDDQISDYKTKILRLKSRSNLNILITGETGTGKDLFANAIHEVCRKDKPLIRVNVAAIIKDQLENQLFGHKKGAYTGADEDSIGEAKKAEGGTLFLDEIGDLPLEFQPKLLRFLENREIQPVGGSVSIVDDLNVVMATKRDLHESVKRGTFRDDLFYRMGWHFKIPPLRERRGDIPLLVDYFIKIYDSAYRDDNNVPPLSLTIEAIVFLLKSELNWERNVRQVKDLVERIVHERNFQNRAKISLHEISRCYNEMFPQSTSADFELVKLTDDLILSTLEKNSGNRTWTAKELGISIRDCFRKLENMKGRGIEVPPPGKRQRYVKVRRT